MVRAMLICSADECPTVFEAYGPLEEVEALACDCGCALEVVGWPQPTGGPVEGVAVLELAA